MRYLVVRIGAFGDCLIITPLLRYLKERGNEVYVLTSDSGLQMLANNPNINKIIHHKTDSVENEKLHEYFEAIKKENECEELIDLCESIEVALALDSKDPRYKWPKWERKAVCDQNYYEYTFKFAKVNPTEDINFNEVDCLQTFFQPEMFFTEEEENKMMDFRKEILGYKTILWGLSGSGRNKTYPYVPYIVGDLIRKYPELRIVLVGDEACQILESSIPKHHRIIKRSGLWSMRESCLFAKYASLVVSPDTGLLHAAGCFETPKIGLLGHTTIKNITKYFRNDFSIEAGCDCAPCFKLIQEAATECPIDVSGACLCMSAHGIDPKNVLERICNVIDTR